MISLTSIITIREQIKLIFKNNAEEMDQTNPFVVFKDIKEAYIQTWRQSLTRQINLKLEEVSFMTNFKGFFSAA